MIRASVGFSGKNDPLAAAGEAGSLARSALGDVPPDWCLAFTTSEHREGIDLLLCKLAETVGTPYVVGCSAMGVLAGGDEAEEGPALGVLLVASDHMRGTPFLFGNEGELGYAAGLRIGERLTTSCGTEELILVLPDPLHVRPDRLLLGIHEQLEDVPIVGGAASSAGNTAPTFQFCGEECRTGAVSGLRLGGNYRYRVAVTQGCRPLGRPLRVTRTHENLILEIEGQPAYRFLADQAPAGLLDRGDEAFHYLFTGFLPEGGGGDVRPGEYFVRNIITADPSTGVIAVGDRVGEGRDIIFALREAEAAKKDLLRVAGELREGESAERYRFGVYFNCLARGSSFYGEEGVDAGLLREALPGVPLIGFRCNAEMAPLRGVNRLFTYTGVLVLIGE